MTVAVRIRDYGQLRAALAARRRQLGLTQLDADEKAGLQSNYVGKIEIGTRKLGPLSLPTAAAKTDPQGTAYTAIAPGSAAWAQDRKGSFATGMQRAGRKPKAR